MYTLYFGIETEHGGFTQRSSKNFHVTAEELRLLETRISEVNVSLEKKVYQSQEWSYFYKFVLVYVAVDGYSEIDQFITNCVNK